MTKPFPTFIGSVFSTDQANNASKSCCSIYASSGDFISFNGFMLAANSNHCVLKAHERSFTYVLNGIGPSTDLSGIPLEIVPKLEKPDPTLNRCRYPVRNSLSQASGTIPRPELFSRSRRHT